MAKVSKSQTLRGVIYRLWEKDNKGFKDFDKYYEDLMDKIINFYKNKLQE